MTTGVWQRCLMTASIALAVFGMSARASADTVWGVTSTGNLITFDSATPGTVTTVAITGLQVGETLLGIDQRPATGQLYGLGSTNRLYLINPTTGVATAVNAVPFAALDGTAFGFDFNPTVDAIRVVSNNEQNFRLNPNTGAIVNVDTDLTPAGSVVASAYVNNFAGTATTTLYGIDSAADTLVLQGGINQSPSPNLGVISDVGPLGVDTADEVGFDIGSNNTAFAALNIAGGGTSTLFTINLNTGAATSVGAIGSGLLVTALAVRSPVAVTLYGVTPTNALISFNSATPGTLLTTVGISGLQVGESVLGIDARPATGQIYALGSSGRIYTIDPVSGQALQIGVPIALNGTEFGVDFNPTVDRLRIISNAEQNLRVHPDTGAVAGTDTPLTPAGEVTGAAYTNNFAGATQTTLFDIDASTDQLVRQGGVNGSPSPNLGVLTPVGALDVDTTSVLGFDISSQDGTAFAALNVGGLSRLYTINLTTGDATLVGTIGAGGAVRGLTAAFPGRVRFHTSTFFTTEGDATASITVTREGSPNGVLPFTVTSTDGTATAGADYLAVNTSGAIPNGQASTTFQVTMSEDLTDEPDETVNLTLTTPTPGTLGTPATAQLVILDNDAPNVSPTVTITTPTGDPTFTAGAPFITVAGTAADDGSIETVTWFTDRGASGTATGTTAWTAANVPVQMGTTIITVVATDNAGSSFIDVLTVTLNSVLYTLAEGATGTFFDTDVLLANPNTAPAPVTLDFLKEDGTTLTQTMTLQPLSRVTLLVDSISGLENTAVSTNVTSTTGLPLIVERTMRWDATGYGAHTEKATAGPATTWYFAEGSQGFFQTFLLLSNPGTTPSTATVQWLLEGGTTVTTNHDLPPTSRDTIFAGDVPGLVDQSFGIVVTFTQPGVAERAMYFGTPTFNGGHESAGETSPATDWFLAEGATGTFFTTFVLMANPNADPADLDITYFPASGLPVSKTQTLAGNARLTLNIAAEDPTLAGTSVATRVQSSQPIVVERAQYWPGLPDTWYEAHNSFGVTQAGQKWGLAEGRVGGPNVAQTYILLANPGTEEATVTLQYLREPGSSPQTVTQTVTVAPTSRFTVPVDPFSTTPPAAGETFGAIITSTQPIVVERALYFDAGGVLWAAGTNATATRLP
jgi:hypothetical protein